jgi:hypothetical protein
MAQSKGRFNVLAMLLAFGAMGGFLYWLSIAATPTEIVVAEEEIAQAVSLNAFARNPIMFEGHLVAVDGVEVQAVLGSQVFFATFPNDVSYPMRVDPSVGAVGGQLVPAAMGRVTGTVYAMTDSILEAWAAESVFADDTQREAAAASTTFLLASELDLAAAAEAAEGADGA